MHLNMGEGLLYFGDKVVIPVTLRKDTLHLPNQGVTAIILKAQSSFFWFGIQEDIQKKQNICISCKETAPFHCTHQ